jgi:hypothetical protein
LARGGQKKARNGRHNRRAKKRKQRMRNYSTARKIARAENFPPDEAIFENHCRELRRLDDLAFTFLTAAGGDKGEAEKLFDDAVDLLFEGGALSTWRYRIVLSAIRAGL